MGGSNPNTSIQPLNMNAGANQPTTHPQSTKPWEVDSSHPEYVTQGISKGVSSFVKEAAGGYTGMQGASSSQTPNSTGGYDSQKQVQKAAPNAAGYSYVDGIGWVPQAQGVNYQPDQGERMWGSGNTL